MAHFAQHSGHLTS